MSIEAIKKLEPLFGSWYVKEQLGKGAYGEVYLIEREDALHIKSRSALKYIHISSSMGSVSSSLEMESTNGGTEVQYYHDIAEGIVKEVEIMSSLKGSSNIVSYEDHACIPQPDGKGWEIIIRMELLTSLQDHVKTHAMTEADTIQLGIDICTALQLCEERGIIHRDIKPGNIMLSDNGSYKLGDFGIARTVERGTLGGFSRKGTYPYMAPEIYRDEDYSDNVDIYSLGIVMYQLMNNGRIPFLPPFPQQLHPGDEEEAMKRRIKGEEIPSPEIGSDALKRIILKACAYRPADRFASAKEMKQALEHLTEPIPPEPDEPGQKPNSPKWIPFICAGAVVLLLAIFLLVILPGLSGQKTTEVANSTPVSAPAAKPTTVQAAMQTEVPEPIPTVELAWTGWDDRLPEGITADNDEFVIEARQLYRSAPLYRLESGTVPEDAVVFSTEYGVYTPWSDWGNTVLYGSDQQEVESREVSWWSEWSNWTSNRLTSSNSTKVESREVGNEYHTITHTEYRSQTLYSSTQYRSRTRSKVVYYYKESEWSEFSEDFIRQEDNVLVNMKIQYRYAVLDEPLPVNPGMEHFPDDSIDYSGHYADVEDFRWYGADNSGMLCTVDRIGVLLPDDFMYFHPGENVTIGEIIRAAVIIHRIYYGLPGLLCDYNAGYDLYYQYAQAEGLVVKGEFPNLTKEATRQEMAYLFFNALPQEEWAAINDIEALSDMDMSRKYYNCALQMARAGVISPDEGDTFHPEATATRAQTASIIDKLIYPENRTSAG